MLEKIKHTKQFARFRLLLRRFHLENVADTIYQILEVLIGKILQFDIDVRAAAVAYNFTLAIFPTIIFLFSLIPYIPVEHLDLKIIALLSEVLPKGIFHEAQETIIEIVSKPRGGVLSLGFIFALYASTSGMMALMRAFNFTYETSEKRGFIQARLIAVMLNFLLTFVLVVAIGFLIVGRLLVDFLFDEGVLNRDFTFYALQFLTYFVIFLIFFITISIIYYWAPAIHEKWKFFNAGSITASILTILVSNLFSFYLSNFASYNRLYGAIGTFIALMVWLYLIALILILGFEINASIVQTLYKKDKNKRKTNS
ncbi:YihY/virulence factor BrkB family protein [Arcicella rigui]|uniref:YihY/virulence factor BrkB family protein n=1 Tax=Arcicella rigui TaxID=797020 RepID=A0ABU5QH02_9BACT|nr:YihY/virulence factor BrkB family protein [Arcicella rigui]MEA5141579.1 YihY/virulence factor BrkB family protein [Arcicella rigui]